MWRLWKVSLGCRAESEMDLSPNGIGIGRVNSRTPHPRAGAKDESDLATRETEGAGPAAPALGSAAPLRDDERTNLRSSVADAPLARSMASRG